MDPEMKGLLDRELLEKSEHAIFLEDPNNREIANKYIKIGSEKGIADIITDYRNWKTDVPEYLVNFSSTFLNDTFLDDLTYARAVYGNLYSRLSKGQLIGFGGRPPGVGAIPEAIIHTEEMAKGLEKIPGKFSRIEASISTAVKAIKEISAKEGISIDEVIKGRPEEVYKAMLGCDGNGLILGRCIDSTFLRARYDFIKLKSQLSPYNDMDYEKTHEPPKNKNGFYFDKSGTRYVLLNIEIKNPAEESRYERLFFNLDNFMRYKNERANFMEPMTEQNFEKILLHHESQGYKRLFGA